MQNTNIKTKYNRPAGFVGQQNFPKSVTIPGQDFTPQEIVRNYVQSAVKPIPIYSNEPIHSYATMNNLDKYDLARSNAENIQHLTRNVQDIQNDIKMAQNQSIEPITP